ncbi:MAG: glycoside hydrolase, partial [Chitinophagaceae bacterium]|nr:glycoside hydrolase [Chitinophagaceae bacterium]
WRCIGPHRGGRTVGAVGIADQPNVFYIGVNNGGVWKTTDYGRTWKPIFDDQPTGSIGDIVVAPSNPAVIYVGSGEGLQRPDLSVGDGIYKSVNGGQTWINTGLKEAQQIGGMAIDPTNENRLFVAALGHPYGPNKERGVYRTIDGGKSWQQVLYIDENTGAIQVTLDPKNGNIVYASMWAGRQGPWENGAWNGKESGLYKSVDGGTTWTKLTTGLPGTDKGLGRIGFCIAPSDPLRLYATIDAGSNGGIFRSDDGGQNWYVVATDNRYWGRASDFAELKCDPLNADIVYSANIAMWKSLDGGKTWNEFRGAPGGDDYHRIWINPTNPKIILLASDQGAIITVNGGESYSSWYNQPTAQFYHVSTDNEYPYNVYGGQQESGSVGIASRGNDGQITYREWHPVGVEEYGYVAVDPLDHNIVYGGKITRFDKRTGQVQNIAPEAIRSGKFRFVRTAPVLFSPIDPKTIFFAGNVLFKTRDGGNSWETISPDLTRESWDIPESVGIYTSEEMKKMPRRGVIYTIAPSFKDLNTIWVGTDDGLIQVTRDGGKTWTNVTPPSITSWSKISLMEASHFDVNTAYAAVNRIRCDDMKAHIYKTTDGGKSWKEITTGLPDDPINAIREDPKRAGLLYAGGERAVYVSFDDGDHWQSLRLNMPATSIRDLVIKDDDVVVGTHGRSFWILDDITPLRELTKSVSSSSVIFYKPQLATRVRWNMYTDTPVPQEEPAGENPPDGAIINYYLASDAKEITLEVRTEVGELIRAFSNKDSTSRIPSINFPKYWVRPQQILSGKSGSHRFLWDLRYKPLNVMPTYPISATFQNTQPNATAPWVLPGKYLVTLTVDGKKTVQSLTVRLDPRLKTSTSVLKKQHDLSLQAFRSRTELMELAALVEKRSTEMNALGSTNTDLKKIGDELSQLLSGPGGIARLQASFASIFNILDGSEFAPTTQVEKSLVGARSDFQKLKDQWKTLSDRSKK